MRFDIEEYIPADFAATSRVWIYQSNRLFFLSEALEMEDMLNQFAESWKSHGTPVKGFASLLFGQFLLFMADETSTGVSGCSTDSSVHLVKDIEKKFSVSLFERQTLAFIIKEKVQLLPLSQLAYAIKNQFIDEHTLYFNNTVQTKQELLNNWIIPVKNSWLGKRILALGETQ